MFIRNNPLVVIVDNFDTAYDLFVVHPSNNRLSSKTRQKNSKYYLSNEISNGITIFKPIGFDLYGELGCETIKFIDSIASFDSTFKGLTLPIVFIIFLHMKIQILNRKDY
jgi:hypothetical protein